MQDFVELRRDFDSWNAPELQRDHFGSHSTVQEKVQTGGLTIHTASQSHDELEPPHRQLYAAGDRHGQPDHDIQQQQYHHQNEQNGHSVV